MSAASRSAVDAPAAVQATSLSKSFGGVPALRDASLTLRPGTVHALVGANGAGKSTFVKILAGLEKPDEGEVKVRGERVIIDTPDRARQLGLNFIHQELNLVPGFTVLQNMALGYSLPTRAGLVSWSAVRRRARSVLALFDSSLSLDADVSTLSVSDRWMTSLGRSLMHEPQAIAMDEPTASFTVEEAERLYGVIHTLTSSGVGVLYISHRLDEVLELSDEITVFRNGEVVGRHHRGDLDRTELTESIVGRRVRDLRHYQSEAIGIGSDHHPAQTHPPVLSAQNLKAGKRVVNATFDLRRGEILGIAGLVGSGRTELARALAGADPLTSGSMLLDGRTYSPRSPRDAIARGVALVPEERRSEALVLDESIDFNINLATMRQNRVRRWAPLLSPSRARSAAREYVDSLSIKSASTKQDVAHLSGGNQQKVVLARFLRTHPRVLILDEPTVGVDVGARAEIYELVKSQTSRGTAVLLISSDFEELAICDRVAVMREGRITTILPANKAGTNTLTALCYHHEEEQ